MANLTRLSAAEWQRHIAAQRASGQTQPDYCRQHGLSLHTFRYHKYPRRQADSQQDRQDELPSWRELPSGLATVSASSDWLIELDLGNGVCLRLRQG
jgi:putative transposase